jgi:tetratricopeptide (TPR) repeat protein
MLFSSRGALAALTLCLSLAATHPLPARAQQLKLAPKSAEAQKNEDEARAHFLLGRSLHDRGEFLKAAQEFEQAYAASGRAALLYNIFVAYRDANDAVHATDALRRYLAEEPNVDNRAQLEAKLAAMEGVAKEQAAQQKADEEARKAREAEEQARAQSETKANQQAVDQAASEQPAEAEEKAFPLGPVIVMGVGGVMILSSIGTGLVASGAQSDLEDGCPTRTNCDPSLEDTKDKGETFALVTDVLLFGGIAVAGAGAAWLLIDMMGSDEAAPEPSTTADLACSSNGCIGTLRGKF